MAFPNFSLSKEFGRGELGPEEGLLMCALNMSWTFLYGVTSPRIDGLQTPNRRQIYEGIWVFPSKLNHHEESMRYSAFEVRNQFQLDMTISLSM